MTALENWLTAVTTHPVFLTLGGFALALLVLMGALNQIKPPEPRRSHGHEDTNPWFRAVGYAGFLLVPILLAIFIAALATVVELWQSPPPDSDPLALRVHYLAIVGFIGVLGGILGALGAYIRVFATERQTTAQEQGLITERINKAVENLGATRSIKRQRLRDTGKRAYEHGEDGEANVSKPIYEEITEPNIEVRIGAIYALERIAKDSLRDHIQIMEIICAYIRINHPAKKLVPPPDEIERPLPALDLAAAISVVGRRPSRNKKLERQSAFRLDLRGTDLSGVAIKHADFDGAIFSNCNLVGAVFDLCSLRGIRLDGAMLDFSSFFDCDMTGARLDHATMSKTPGAWLSGWPFIRTKCTGMVLCGANVRGLRNIGDNTNSTNIFGDSDTELRFSLAEGYRELKPHLTQRHLYVNSSNERDRKRFEEAVQGLGDSVFANWSPYTTADAATTGILRKFHSDLGLEGFPYSD